jgi:DNA-binding XRE family transcriptional regulator
MVQVSWKKVMRLKKIRSKYQLAQILEYPYKSINKLFHPDYNPPIKTLGRHAAKLGCKVRDLIKE